MIDFSGVAGVTGKSSWECLVGEAVLTNSFRDVVAGETGEKVGLSDDNLLSPSNLNQSKLNFSLKGLTSEAERLASAMTTSPSQSAEKAGLKNDSARGIPSKLECNIVALNMSSCFSLFKSA